jgi:hypothetical protein
MRTIYEVPGLFRITYMRSSARQTPFILEYRAPTAEKVEVTELPNELFRTFLTIDRSAQKEFSVLLKYARPAISMSAEMLDCLLNAPKTLLSYVEDTANEDISLVACWQSPDDAPVEYGIDVLACVSESSHYAKQAHRYDVIKAYCNPDGWFDSETGKQIEPPDYCMRIPPTPPVKR